MNNSTDQNLKLSHSDMAQKEKSFKRLSFGELKTIIDNVVDVVFQQQDGYCPEYMELYLIYNFMQCVGGFPNFIKDKNLQADSLYKYLCKNKVKSRFLRSNVKDQYLFAEKMILEKIQFEKETSLAKAPVIELAVALYSTVSEINNKMETFVKSFSPDLMENFLKNYNNGNVPTSEDIVSSYKALMEKDSKNG